jgi:hypothetical protein
MIKGVTFMYIMGFKYRTGIYYFAWAGILGGFSLFFIFLFTGASFSVLISALLVVGIAIRGLIISNNYELNITDEEVTITNKETLIDKAVIKDIKNILVTDEMVTFETYKKHKIIFKRILGYEQDKVIKFFTNLQNNYQE